MSESKIVTDDKSLELAAIAVTSMEVAEERKVERTAVNIVEDSVADFLERAIRATLESNKLSQALEDSLAADLSEMSVTEKITLFNIDRSSTNDKWFKILSPSIGLLTARQQALIQAASKEQQAAAVQVNVGAVGGGNPIDAKIAASAPPEAISGIASIFQLAESRKAELARAKAAAAEVEVKDDDDTSQE